MEDAETCPATNRNGEPCGQPAGWGTETNSGPCRYHGGAGGDVGDVRGAPEGNDNAETHSLTSDPQKYYRRQPESEQDCIDSWAESWARRANYGLPGYDSVLHEAAVILHQIHGADEHIAEEGIIVERIIGRTEAGDPIVEEDENPAFLLKSRAMKDLIRTLKEFGCLDDPDSKQAEAVQDTADALRSFMEAADQ